jgi:carbon-monoxide dehydrogenase medium subunit
MGPFEYFEPETLKEAISWLKKYGPRARVLAGGTDLVPSMKEKTVRPEYIISIGRITSLDYLHFDGEKGIKIGALTTIRKIEQSKELQPKYGLLCQAARQMASTAVRNVGTIGGNLCNCSPAADMATALLAMSATTRLVSSRRERIVPLEQFLCGPGATALRPDELLAEIRVPYPPARTGGVYIKYGARGGEDLALVSVAALITLGAGDGICSEAKLTLGSVAPTAMRAYKAEAALKGKKLDQKLIEKAAQIASDESSPIDDIRGSAQYRREMLKVFARDAIKQAAELAKSI